jgi:hypothetical protein
MLCEEELGAASGFGSKGAGSAEAGSMGVAGTEVGIAEVLSGMTASGWVKTGTNTEVETCVEACTETGAKSSG